MMKSSNNAVIPPAGAASRFSMTVVLLAPLASWHTPVFFADRVDDRRAKLLAVPFCRLDKVLVPCGMLDWALALPSASCSINASLVAEVLPLLR